MGSSRSSQASIDPSSLPCVHFLRQQIPVHVQPVARRRPRPISKICTCLLSQQAEAAPPSSLRGSFPSPFDGVAAKSQNECMAFGGEDKNVKLACDNSGPDSHLRSGQLCRHPRRIRKAGRSDLPRIEHAYLIACRSSCGLVIWPRCREHVFFTRLRGNM